MNKDEITRIKTLLADQVQAICSRDTVSATKNYAKDVVIFDVVGPLAHPAGAASVEERLKQWLSSFAENAAINFELVDLSVEADENLAFSHSFNHVSASLRNGGALDMFWRETLNWCKVNGEWKIIHAHSSVPFDPATGQALTGLKPSK